MTPDPLRPPGVSAAAVPPGGRVFERLDEPAALVVLLDVMAHMRGAGDNEEDGWVNWADLKWVNWADLKWVNWADLKKDADSLGYKPRTVRDTVDRLVGLGLLEVRRSPSSEPTGPEVVRRWRVVRATADALSIARAASACVVRWRNTPSAQLRWEAEAAAANALGNVKRARLLLAMAREPGKGLDRQAVLRAIHPSIESAGDGRRELTDAGGSQHESEKGEPGPGVDVERLLTNIRNNDLPPLRKGGLMRTFGRAEARVVNGVEPTALPAVREAVRKGCDDPQVIAYVATLLNHHHRLEVFTWFTDPRTRDAAKGCRAEDLTYAFGDSARNLALQMVKDGLLVDQIDRGDGSVTRRRLDRRRGKLTETAVLPGSWTNDGQSADARVVQHAYWLHPDFEVGGELRRVVDALMPVFRAGADVQERRSRDLHPVMELLAKPTFRRIAWSMLEALDGQQSVSRQGLMNAHGLSRATVGKALTVGVRIGLFTRITIGGRSRVIASDHCAVLLALGVQMELGLEVGLKQTENAARVALELRDKSLEAATQSTSVQHSELEHRGPRSQAEKTSMPLRNELSGI